MIGLSRLVALAMGAVICFALVVPLALARHQPTLAIAVGVLFVAYAAFNLALWRRYRP